MMLTSAVGKPIQAPKQHQSASMTDRLFFFLCTTNSIIYLKDTWKILISCTRYHVSSLVWIGLKLSKKSKVDERRVCPMCGVMIVLSIASLPHFFLQAVSDLNLRASHVF